MSCHHVTKERWNLAYRQGDSPGRIQRDMPQIVEVFQSRGVVKVLDLGCGSGRHTMYLAGRGFTVVGMDISEEGVTATRMSLKDEGLQAELKVGSMYEPLPFESELFDAIVCIRSLNHGTISDIRNAISEMHRIVRPQGLVYVTVVKRIGRGRVRRRQIAPRTYVHLEGREEGVVHFDFTKAVLQKEFRHFEIEQLYTNVGPEKWHAYYVVLARRPSD